EHLPQGAEHGEVELAVRVEPPRHRRAMWGKHAVRADDLTGLLLPDEEVVAVRVQLVDIEPGRARVEVCAHLLGEYAVPQPLSRANLIGGGRYENAVAWCIVRRGGGAQDA